MKEYGATLLRVTLGAIYLMHAYGALVSGLSQKAAYLENVVGFPAPTLMALTLIAVQGVGGAMLVLGLWTRPVAAANAVVSLTLLYRAHLPQGFFLRGVVEAGSGRMSVAGYEYDLLLTAATIALAMIGSGALALGRSR